MPYAMAAAAMSNIIVARRDLSHCIKGKAKPTKSPADPTTAANARPEVRLSQASLAVVPSYMFQVAATCRP